MSCFKYFCCGYSLETGGSFIGYYSIATYIKLTLLCLFYLWCIRARIGENEGTPSFLHQISHLVRARSGHRQTGSSLQDLKSDWKCIPLGPWNSLIYLTATCVVLIIYVVFLFVGILSASCLITGTKLVGGLLSWEAWLIFNFLQKTPNYLWWWLIYQGVFIAATAVVVIVLVQIRDETFGFLTHLKNYVLQIVVTAFIVVSLVYFLLLIYFWFNVLSLYIFLRKEILKKKENRASTDSRLNLTGDIDAASLAVNKGSVQLIPINLQPQGGESEGRENGKFFILYV